MAAQVGAVSNETENLLGYLAQSRYTLRLTAYGLTPEQLRATPSASSLSVGGIIKHCASTEENWLAIMRHESRPVDYGKYAADFVLADDETIEDVFARYDRVAAEIEKTVAEIGDLDAPVPVDHSVPWNPKDIDNWSIRWVLLHLVEEVARHNGHADIIRETVDGATGYPLLAAAEGWPDSPWLSAWKKPV